MAKLELWYPVSPFVLIQPYGVNGDYYKKFHDPLGNPLKGHNGNDLRAAHGQPVYAPCDGKALYSNDPHGGEGIFIYTGKYAICLWHLIGKSDPTLPSPIPTDGVLYDVKAGDLVGYADNTGAPYESSGDHLHLAVSELNDVGTPLNPGNGFSGYIDPAPFYNGYYATDIQKVVGILQTLKNLYEKLIGFIAG